MATFQRREITVEGVRLAYLERGSADPLSPSLLCLHGLVATADSFVRMAEGLPPERHIIALDLPGNGSSERNAALDVSFAGLAKLVGAFARAVGLVRPVLAGHSHGGALALRLAVDSPEAVRGLLLLAPAHPFSGREEAVVRFYLSFKGVLFAHLLSRLPRRLQMFGFRKMLGSGNQGDPEWFEPYWRNLRHRGTVGHTLRLLKSWQADMLSLRGNLRAGAVRVPVLMIWGAQDGVVPAGTGGGLRDHLPGSELVILPGVGHLPNEEDPRRCGELIGDWLVRFR